MNNFNLPSREDILAQQREAAQQKDVPEETRRRVREAIGRVHGSSTSPMYVGDMPGAFTPVVQPKRDDLIPSMKTDLGEEMVVWMVWVVDDSDPDQVPWLVGARDDASVQANLEDWESDVQEARESWGSVIITRTTVNYAKVRAAFEPLEI